VLREDDIGRSRFAAYAARRNFRGPRFLGSGKDGVVHEVESNDFPGVVAVKTFYRPEQFQRERNAYVRLREGQVVRVGGCCVPQLIGYDNHLLTIEMTIVAPPFILDFADAWLDELPEFSDEVWSDWNRKLDDDFGERATEVRRMLAVLRCHGVILLDVHPGNIRWD
jgi:hypothetical protein